MSAQHWNSGYLARDGGPPYCGGCKADWPCPGSVMEKQERDALLAIAASVKPPLLPDDDTAVERVKAALPDFGMFWREEPREPDDPPGMKRMAFMREEYAAAIIAALREGGPR